MFNNDKMKSPSKKNSILRKTKSFLKDSDKKNDAKIIKFLHPKNNIDKVNENNESLSKYNNSYLKGVLPEKIEEDIKKDTTNINNIQQFEKYKFTKKYNIDI